MVKKRGVDPIIPELGGHVGEDTGFHPKCSEKPLAISKHGIAWSDLSVSEMTMAVVSTLKGIRRPWRPVRDHCP